MVEEPRKNLLIRVFWIILTLAILFALATTLSGDTSKEATRFIASLWSTLTGSA